MSAPHVVVLSSLFPSKTQPVAGIFVRERMFRVGRELPLTVVSPQPWFPGQALLRRLKPGYRLGGDYHEVEAAVDIYRPRFFAVPGIGRTLDGLSMAAASYRLMRRLRRAHRCDVIDAHFAYPDGQCAALLGRWLGVPVSVTLRGTEPRYLALPRFRRKILAALRSVQRIFAVSDSLRRLVLEAGIPADRVRVVGNGVDIDRFYPMPQAQARARLGLPERAKILITVGGLIERKGFHRVIAELPKLIREFPDLLYLIVGGPCPEGDWTERLRELTLDADLSHHVRFLGALGADDLSVPLSASDVFVLPSSNEGWANVILEAMACGIPVVASDVGGNAEVVCTGDVGLIYPFEQPDRLHAVLAEALSRRWDREKILDYARGNTWDTRVRVLVEEFMSMDSRNSRDAASRQTAKRNRIGTR